MNNIINIDGQRYIKIEEYTNLTAEIRREVEHRHQLEDRCKDLTAEVERLKDDLDAQIACTRLAAERGTTPPAKPVVWVMRTASANYYRVTESGNTFSESWIYERMQWWKAIYAGIAEVRVWPETCEACGHVIASEGR